MNEVKNGKVGLGTLIADAVRSPFERLRARTVEARVSIKEDEYYETMIGEAAKVVYPEDDSGWELISNKPLGGTAATTAGKDDLRTQARKAFYQSPLIVGFIKSLIRFVIGPGAAYSASTDDDDKNEVINETWSDWTQAVRWSEIEKEICSRTWRDGECFIHRQKNPGFRDPSIAATIGFSAKQKNTLARANITTAMMTPQKPYLTLRMLDPEHIKDPTSAFSDGIVTDPNDVETVLGYLYCPSSNTDDLTFLPVEDVLHIKIRVDRNTKRGRSLLEPLLPLNTKYEQWLHYRIVLNKVRSAVAWIKSVSGPASNRNAIRNSRKAQRDGVEVARGENRVQVPRAGTTVTATPGVDYDFKNPNLQAADAQHDGREIKLNIAATTGLPEYMITGDASNANYSSTMVAESPGVREFEYWQDVFSEYFGYIWNWVLSAAIEFGVMTGVDPEEIASSEVQISFPPLIARNKLDEAKANQIKAGAGILSKQTWSEEDGRDWQTEKERIEAEAEEEIGLGVPSLSQFGVDPNEEDEEVD